jgi:hypothetical protein
MDVNDLAASQVEVAPDGGEVLGFEIARFQTLKQSREAGRSSSGNAFWLVRPLLGAGRPRAYVRGAGAKSSGPDDYADCGG